MTHWPGGTGPVKTMPVAAVAGAAAAYGWLAARSGARPGGSEGELLVRLNRDRNSSLYRGPQQLGTPWVLPALAAVAALTGRRSLAVAAAVALPLEKTAEVGTKKFVRRPRPVRQVPGIVLRDDAPDSGPSYPSGHAAIAVSTVVLLRPHLPMPATATGVVLAVLAGHARVVQGAHFPSDVVGGILLGVVVGEVARALGSL